MKNKSALLLTLLLGLAFLGLRPVSAAAAIKQTKATKNAITISWDNPYADSTTYQVTGYEIRYIKYADSQKIDSRKATKLGAGRTSYTLTGLKPGTKYYARLTYTYGYMDYSGNFREYSNTLTAYDLYTLPGKVTGINQTRWWHYANAVDFSWNKQDACNYQWKITKNNGSAFAKNNNTSSNYGSADKTSNTMTYKLQVRAFVTDKSGKKHYGDWSNTAYLFGQPMVTAASVKKGTLSVSWNRVTGMNKYQIYVSKKRDSGYKLVKTVSSTAGKASISKLGSSAIANNGTYYVYIVGLKKVGSNTYTSGVNYTWKVKGSSCSETYKN